MAQNGLLGLIRADNRRVEGWRILREYLKVEEQESGREAKIVIFDHVLNLIRCLPSLTYDKNNPEDCSDAPHEITHAPEAIRYAVMSRPLPTKKSGELQGARYTKTELDDIKKPGGQVIKRK